MFFVMGIDAGTSHTKAVLFDEKGEEVLSLTRPTRLSHPEEGAVEGNLSEMKEDVFFCIRECAEKSGVSSKIVAIGISATGDGTCLLDKRGAPVRNMMYWCDGRASEIVLHWNKNRVAEKAFGICGITVFPGSQAAQLRFLAKREPESLTKAAHIVHAKDFLFAQLTGKIQSDETDQSLPMLNMRTRAYDDELFRLFEIESLKQKFPKLFPVLKNFAGLTRDAAAQLGLKEGIPVCSGPMDVVACAVGAGAVETGDACSVLGTAAIHEIVMDEPDFRPEFIGMTLCHAEEDRWLRMLAPMIATPNLDWFLNGIGKNFAEDAKRMGRELYAYLEECAEGVAPGCDGMLYHPYIYPGGERAPFVCTKAAGSFTGIRSGHTENHFLRAVYEGVGYAMRDCYDSLPAKPRLVRLTGGGAKSEFWCQMLADITGIEIAVPVGKEFGAKGAALCAMTAAGLYPDLRSAVRACVKFSKCYHPDPEKKQSYVEAYQKFRRIRGAMLEIWRDEERNSMCGTSNFGGV